MPDNNSSLKKKIEGDFPEQLININKLINTLIQSFLKSESDYGAIDEIAPWPSYAMTTININLSNPINQYEPSSEYILYYGGAAYYPDEGQEMNIIGTYDLFNDDAAIIFIRQRLSILMKVADFLKVVLTEKKSIKHIIKTIKSDLRIKVKNDELYAVQLILKARGEEDVANRIITSKFDKF